MFINIKKSNHKFDFVDLGGGMGIKYTKDTKLLNYKKLRKNVNINNLIF